jgi:hypothetical protein
MEATVWREERSDWTQQDELLATCVEVIDAWGRQLVATLVAVNGGKLRDQGEPLRIRHPDREEPEPQKKDVTTDPSRIAAFLRPQAH